MTNPTDPPRPHSGDAGEPLGVRLAQLRGTMTQRALATRSGVSVDVIRKLEQGQRHHVAIRTLHRLAAALDVDAGVLLSKPHRLTDGGDHAGAVTIRQTLTAVDDLIGEDLDVEPLSVEDGRRTLAFGWGSYWSGRYDQLGHLLPTAIIRCRAAVRDLPVSEQPAAANIAAEVMQLAAAAMVQLDFQDIAHLALREALGMARRGDDPLRVEALRSAMAWVLLVQGRFHESERLAAAAARTVAPSGKSPMPAWSLFGSLLLSSATAAGRRGDRATAAGFLDEAVDVARVTGNRNDYELSFGPDQLAMQRVDVETVTEHYSGALTAAKTLPREASLPLASRARHLSDVALAHTRLGHDEKALDTLEAMYAIAPAWAEFQAQPKQIVRELRARSNPTRLASLARKLGMTNG